MQKGSQEGLDKSTEKTVYSPGGCEFALIRSKRRTAAIYIRPGGRVEVRAPLGMARRDIDRFVDQKAGWIAKHAAASAASAAQRQAFRVEPGRRFLWLGVEYPAVYRPGCPAAGFDGGRFLLPSACGALNRPAMVQLYRDMAAAYIAGRVEIYAARMGLRPRSVRVTGARTRWGSCSGKNGLCFSWRLALAPPFCVDYVVVHELCHMKEHNHSPAFWRQVEEVLPDYPSRRDELKRYGRLLARQNWEDAPADI